MMKKQLTFAAFAIVSLGAFASGAHAAGNLLTNGSFEDPVLPNFNYGLYSSIPGWTLVSGNSIEVQRNRAGTAQDGQQLVELDSNGSSAIAQTVNTTVGQHYHLSFAFSARPGFNTTENHLGVTWTSGAPVSVADLSADGTGLPDTNWNIFNYDLIANSTTATIKFADLGTSDNVGTYIDNIQLTAATATAVPEPSSWAAFGAGALVLGAMAMRRRKVAA